MGEQGTEERHRLAWDAQRHGWVSSLYGTVVLQGWEMLDLYEMTYRAARLAGLDVADAADATWDRVTDAEWYALVATVPGYHTTLANADTQTDLALVEALLEGRYTGPRSWLGKVYTLRPEKTT